MEQNYLMVNPQQIVDNIIVWDGNPDTWTPPNGYTMLVQATTPAIVWVYDSGNWSKQEVMGAGAIGYLWDGSVLQTQDPQPTYTPK